MASVRTALMLAAYHPDQFRYAASYSGCLNTMGPGMPAGLRAAMLDAGGFDIDAMWGPAGGLRRQRNNPTEFAALPHAHGARLWISAGNGSPGPHDAVAGPEDAYRLTNSEALEAISLSNTRAFQARWDGFGPGNAVFDRLPASVHNGPYWTDGTRCCCRT
jgi:diacylglycerol O-acyltransferase / trehalose O-mycolyltransferase